MRRVLLFCSLTLALGALLGAADAPATTAPFLSQDSMNVFRRFGVDRAKMLEFYGGALGLKPLSSFDVGGQGGMSRFAVGTTQLKLTAAPRTAHYPSGEARAVRGLRVWTFFFPDERALTARLAMHGYPAPAFVTVERTRRALVADPDGQWVELVVAGAGAPPETFDRMEVGIAAGNVDDSRAFYRSFVGLEELPPVRDALLGVTAYPFRHGTTTVNVWAASDGERPSNSGAAGIQYVVNDVEAVNALAASRHVRYEQPLRESLPGLRTVWLQDPDGVTNYYAQVLPRQSTR
jgi:catechol 2,3-dioxygenase-like lactoylglutathione lyase family enzyme